MIRAYRLLSEVRVLALKDLNVITLGKERLNVRRGDEINLPLWLALELSASGYVEILDVGMRDVDLLRYYHVERSSRGGRLADLREDVYFLAGLAIARYSKEKPEGETLKAERMRGALANLIDLRLNKLVSAALNLDVKRPSEVSKILEEMILYKLLREVLDSWKNSVLGYAKQLS